MYHHYDIVSNSDEETDLSCTGLREVAVGVESLERSIGYYRDALGLAPLRRGAIPAPTAKALWGLDRGADSITLGRPSLPAAPPATQAPPAPAIRLVELASARGRSKRDTMTPGPLGIGFTTRGIHEVFERLESAGLAFQSPPVELTPEPEGPTGPRRFEAFGQTPDGEFVVIIERHNAPAPYGTLSERWHTSEPLHTSHVVDDLGAARRFMESVLDHTMIFREECAEPEIELLMGIPAGTRFCFEMLQHPEHGTGRIIFIEYEGARATPGFAQPPARGLQALRYDCDDLEGALARAVAAGGEVLRPPVSVDTAALGSGRVAGVGSPVGILLELWQPE